MDIDPDTAGVERLPPAADDPARHTAPVGRGGLVVRAIGGGITVGPREGRTVLFGRNADDVHVCVGAGDRGVSRLHGTLTCRDGHWWLHNLGRSALRLGTRRLCPQGEQVPLSEGPHVAGDRGLERPGAPPGTLRRRVGRRRAPISALGADPSAPDLAALRTSHATAVSRDRGLLSSADAHGHGTGGRHRSGRALPAARAARRGRHGTGLAGHRCRVNLPQRQDVGPTGVLVDEVQLTVVISAPTGEVCPRAFDLASAVVARLPPPTLTHTPR